MRLSFIIPAHNEEAELPATLRALQQALAAAAESQPGVITSAEIIVTDDDSTDRTATIAQEHGVRVERVKKRQIAAVRNAGAHTASGEVLVFIDADTRIRADHVLALTQAIADGAYGGGAPFLFEEPIPRGWRFLLKLFNLLYFGAGLGAGCFLFVRRIDFDAFGGFDERYFAGEEVYFTWAVKKRGRFILLKKPVETSARKLRLYRPTVIMRQLMLFSLGPWVLRHPRWLRFWYGGEREPARTPPAAE
jgi:glycosyltransferase involved in cell wall biosynthesis